MMYRMVTLCWLFTVCTVLIYIAVINKISFMLMCTLLTLMVIILTTRKNVASWLEFAVVVLSIVIIISLSLLVHLQITKVDRYL